VTKVVSKIGTIMINRGTILMNNKFVASCQDPSIVIIDRIKPKNRLPLSPMKIFAGLKLYIRKPRDPPDIIAANMATKMRLPWRAYMNIHIEEIKEIPLESPSILSRILKALVIPTIHRIVNGMAIKGIEMISIFTPKKTTVMAIIT
jgi:hypothetical protein